MSYDMSAKMAGASFKHSSVKRMLMKKCYAGDSFYPAIIDRETFLAAYDRIKATPRSLNTRRDSPNIYPEVVMNTPEQAIENPSEQAEYIYSLIGVK